MIPDDETCSGRAPSSVAICGNPGNPPRDPLRAFNSLSVLPPTTGHSIRGGGFLSLGNPYTHPYHVCRDSAVLSTGASTHANQQIQCNLPSWSFDPLGTPWLNSLYGQLPSSIINAGVHDPGPYHAEPNDSRPLLRASHVMDFPLASPPNDQNTTGLYTSFRLSSHPPSGQSSPPSLHYQSPTESLGSAPRFCVIPPRRLTALSPRGQSARAIEYGGMWLDEQELLTARVEPIGTLYVFRCRWQEDRSPCRLWIKGEKSSINAHMQKWHGDKPGGDKSEVECRWSDCKTTMLKESITRHVVRVHLGEVWVCQGCQKKSTRHDVHKQHTATSDVEACGTSGALTTYSVGVVVVDARAALEGGGQVRYASDA